MSPDRLSIEVTDALAGERVDRVVSLALEVSRSVANEMIGSGSISINGRVVTKPSERVEHGQRITLPAQAEVVGMEPDPAVVLDLVHVDEDVIVVNKPAGMVVHPGAGISTGTLVQGLLAQFPAIADVGERDRPGIVHRLDKGTSGLLMIARSERAYDTLTDQLRHRIVGRQYWALVHGEPEAAEGIVDAPIGRSLRHPTRQTVRPDGKEARTSYEVLERFDPVSGPLALLQFVLETGRTHQIRVHADAIGLPLVGDERYGRMPVPDELTAIDRPLLHARTLAFEHPDGRFLQFLAEVPADFASALSSLGSNAASG